MRSMDEYYWAQDKIDELRDGDKKHREQQACERRLRQMTSRREKAAKRQALKAGQKAKEQ